MGVRGTSGLGFEAIIIIVEDEDRERVQRESEREKEMYEWFRLS